MMKQQQGLLLLVTIIIIIVAQSAPGESFPSDVSKHTLAISAVKPSLQHNISSDHRVTSKQVNTLAAKEEEGIGETRLHNDSADTSQTNPNQAKTTATHEDGPGGNESVADMIGNEDEPESLLAQFIKDEKKDPPKVYYINEDGEVSLEKPAPVKKNSASQPKDCTPLVLGATQVFLQLIVILLEYASL